MSLWLRGLTLVLSACVPLVAAAAEPLTIEQLHAARTKAAERKRHLIFNNDGNEPVYLCKDTTPEELLRHRTSPLVGSQVDSIFYCTWSLGSCMFTHPTKVGQVFDTHEGRFSTNLTDKMLAAGTDPLKVMVDFGKKNNIEIFWSYRMNDTHDGSPTDYGPIMFKSNRMKNEHPDWLIGSPAHKPKHGFWSAVDFTRPEIRDLAVRYVEEVCRNYDVDGVELDFFRHPVFFKRASQSGTPCNDEERGLMTDLVRRVRAMTEVEGRKRGRPILVAIRAPDSVEYCRIIGLDLQRWMEEGLMDLFVPAGYFQLNHWDYSVNLGRKFGVRVYPSLDESRVVDPKANAMRMTPEAYRGRALNAWQAGADGIYLFNFFDPRSTIWRELGSPKLLAGLDQDYFASARGQGGAAGGAYPHVEFQNIPRLNPRHFLPVTPGQTAKVTFQVGNDLANNPQGKKMAAQLHLQFKTKPTDDLQIFLNDELLSSPRRAGAWLEFDLQPAWLKKGTNEVRVALPTKASALEWTDLRCMLRVPKN